MRIVIDMQGAQSEASGGRGVGRYTRELTKELISQYGNDVDIYLALNGKLECDGILKLFEDIIPRDHIKTWNFYPYVPPACTTDNDDIRVEELFREWFLHQFDADIIWSSNLQEGYNEANIATSAKITNGNEIVITTLHDVIPAIYENDYLNSPVRRWYFQKIKYACNSDIIITDSFFSRDKIVELFNVDINKIKVIQLGYDRKEFYPNDEYLSKEAKEPFFLYVGGADQHKNLFRLIEAYSKLELSIRKKYKIYFAGKETASVKEKYIEEAKKYGVEEEQLCFLGFITDDELRNMMQKCTAFVFPSYSEGFGLPPLEAMACGAPTLVAHAASLIEIVDDPEATFDPYDVDELTHKLNKVVMDDDYANRLIRKGIQRAANFSWKQAGKQFYEIINDIVSSKGEKILTKHNYSEIDLCKDVAHKLVNCSEEYKAYLAYSIEDSKLFQNKRNIFIDTSAVVLTEYVTGIQRVVNGLVSNLKNIFAKRQDVDVIAIYSDPGSSVFYKSKYDGKKYVRCYSVTQKDIVQFHDGDIFIMPDLHPSNVIKKTNMLRELCKRGIKVITSLNDIIPMQYPEFFEPGFVMEFEQYLEAIACFSGVISISKATMDAYSKWCKENMIQFPPYFIQDYYNLGSDIEKANPSKGLPADYDGTIKKLKKDPTILMVGTIEPRKKHDQVLHAFDKLWDNGRDINLVFVGRNGWEMDSFVEEIINHKEKDNHLFWLSGITDEYLDMIYDCSKGVIVASLQEGYGLPIIEAAQHKKPLLLRDIPVFREIAENNASYFTGEDADSLADAIIGWLEQIMCKKAPDSSGIKFISWEESAKLLISKIDHRLIEE